MSSYRDNRDRYNLSEHSEDDNDVLDDYDYDSEYSVDSKVETKCNTETSSSEYDESSSSDSSSSSKTRRSNKSKTSSSSSSTQTTQPLKNSFSKNICITLIRDNRNQEKDISVSIHHVSNYVTRVTIKDKLTLGENRYDEFICHNMDIYTYVYNLLCNTKVDTDDSKEKVDSIQVFIPMFPTIIIPKEYSETEFYNVMNNLYYYLQHRHYIE